MRVATLAAVALFFVGAFAAPMPTTVMPRPPAPPATSVPVATPAPVPATPVPTPPKSLVWADLYAPPYGNLPEISMSISCVDSSLCYLPGGYSNGFQMLSFNGQSNGNLNPMNEPNMTMMIMSVRAGGNATNPVGVFAGVGIGTLSQSIQYLSNGTTWLPSTVPPALFTEVQSVRTTHDGKHVIALGDGITGPSIMHSVDGGRTFQSIPFKVPLVSPNCTALAYAAMVDGNTWYVTLGSQPNNGSNSNSQGSSPNQGSSSFGHDNVVIRPNTFGSSIARNMAGKVERVHHSALEGHQLRAPSEQCPGFSGQIVKTTDGGQTWKSLVSETSYAFEQIDCISATHCLAVAYGVNAAGNPVSLIFQTMDGANFTQVYSVESTAAASYGFQAVRFVDAHEAWVGGMASLGQNNYGALWFTKDGGKTWKQYADLQPNIVEIFDIDFSQGVGYAVAMTALKTATILRYKQQYFDGYFVQSNCILAGCALCQNMTFPQGLCLEGQGGSAQVYCDDGEIVQQDYQTSSCAGSFVVSNLPINTCLNSTQGNFFENYCLSSKSSGPKPTQMKDARKLRRVN